ncbi:MAG TPA: hypothetical protein VH682_01850, partial [Gemmataceae bacterium]
SVELRRFHAIRQGALSRKKSIWIREPPAGSVRLQNVRDEMPNSKDKSSASGRRSRGHDGTQSYEHL